MPGVQVLFAFLLVVPFNQGWTKVDGFEKAAYFASFLATTLATVLLKAPTAHHRLRWRSRDKEALLQIANRLVIIGTISLAVAVTTAVAFVTHYIFEGSAAAIVTSVTALAFLLIWYAIPLYRTMKADE